VECRDLFVHHFGTRTFAQGAPNPPPPVPERRDRNAPNGRNP
jgi:hypothetical protein